MLVIFDLDGTLCDITHRLHYVRSKPYNWPAFEKGVSGDSPNEDIVSLYEVFAESGEHTIILCSGRSEDSREATEQWLKDNGLCAHVDLLMRPSKNYEKDSIIKGRLADQIEEQYGKIDLVIDDRQQVVDMWRERGITTLQCAEGDF